MEMQDITNIISQIGFPIFVAVYLLIEGRIQNKNICKALENLESAIQILTERVNNGK